MSEMLKEKLPKRLKEAPIAHMESDSDIETIADAIVSLTNEDGEFFKQAEKLLIMASLGYLRDWCKTEQKTMGNLISLLDASLMRDNERMSTLDNLFYEIESGCRRVKAEDGITTLWEPSALTRNDGLTPRDLNGIDPEEDFALGTYTRFTQMTSKETRGKIALPLLLVLDKEEAYGK